MNIRATTALTACSVVASLALTGCLGGEDDNTDRASARTAPPESQAVTATAQPGAGAVRGNPGRRAIASRKGSIEDENVLLEVVELRRSGGTTIYTMRLSVEKGTTGSVQVAGQFDDGFDQSVDGAPITSGSSTLDGISLIDARNRKRYLAGRDSRGACVCDTQLGSKFIEDGTPLELSATFAALPPDVHAVDILIPGFGTLHDVPVS